MLRGLSPVMRQKTCLPIMSTLIIMLLLSPYLLVSGQQYPLKITKIRTLDMEGNEKTIFPRGSTVVIEVTLDSLVSPYEPPTQYLLIVRIDNPQGYTVFIGFVTDVIEPGATKTAGSGYGIPTGASTGTYTVWVFVWNGWPSQMGTNFKVLAEKKQTTFTVT
ncbi:MAG: hypothetical protein FGF50_09680 [Candidatus Brockarchaeota archaeon]|nr:hypothetical protein [Candidatus Brockarchaeota archaeon]